MTNPWLDEMACFSPIPSPSHEWTEEELRALRLEHLRELERSWIEERKRFVLEGAQPWQLDQAIRALHSHLQKLTEEKPQEVAPPESPPVGTEPPVTQESRTPPNVEHVDAHEADSGQDARLRRLL